MSTEYSFDQVARTERYFVSTLLAHLLFADNFYGLRLLFKQIFTEINFDNIEEEFEIVSELDPLRDASVQNSDVKSLYKKHGRIAVPDLFLRWSKYCIVIEAKFFTDPADEDLDKQLSLQNKAIKLIVPHTKYELKHFRFLLITNRKRHIELPPEYNQKTWSNILSLFEDKRIKTPDVDYAMQVLRDAIERAKKQRPRDYDKLNYKQLLRQIPMLIEEGKIYIGIMGGLEVLESMTEDKMRSRSHFKVSKKKWSENWITFDQFIKHVLEQKSLPHINRE